MTKDEEKKEVEADAKAVDSAEPKEINVSPEVANQIGEESVEVLIEKTGGSACSFYNYV